MFYFILVLSSIKLITSESIYISPDSSCYTSCNGSPLQPYNNLWSALVEKSGTNLEFLLLASPSNNKHFLMSHTLMSDYSVWALPTLVSLDGVVTIRPLFCNEIPSTDFLSYCYSNPTDQVTVYLKTENLTILIKQQLNIIGIVFDGSENIQYYNTLGDPLYYCLLNRILCCENGYNPNVNCYSQGYMVQKDPILQGLFLLGADLRGSLFMNNVVFKYMNFVKNPNLIKILTPSDVTIKNTLIQASYFSDGMIKASSADNNQNSVITIDYTYFGYFNPFKFYESSVPSSYGIFINFKSLPASSTYITNSRFENIDLDSLKDLMYFDSGSAQLSQVHLDMVEFLSIKLNTRLIHANEETSSFTNMKFSSMDVTAGILINVVGKNSILDNLLIEKSKLDSSISATKVFNIEVDDTVSVSNVKMSETDSDNKLRSDARVILINHIKGILPNLHDIEIDSNEIRGIFSLIHSVATVNQINNVKISNNKINSIDTNTASFIYISSSIQVFNFLFQFNEMNLNPKIFTMASGSDLKFDGFQMNNNTSGNENNNVVFWVMNPIKNAEISNFYIFLNNLARSGFWFFEGQATVTFNGFYILYNYIWGRLLEFSTNSDITINNFVVNTAVLAGYPCIAAYNSNLTIQNSQIHEAYMAGNIFIRAEYSNIKILDTEFKNNYLGYLGGGRICTIRFSNISIQRVIFDGIEGPAEVMLIGFSYLSLENVKILNCQLHGYTRLIYFDGPGDIIIKNTQIRKNVMRTDPMAGGEGLVFAIYSNTSIEMYNVEVEENIMAYGGYYFNILFYIESPGKTSISNLVFRKNKVSGFSSSLFYVPLAKEFSLQYVTFEDNYLENRGSILNCLQTALRLYNAEFVNNVVVSSELMTISDSQETVIFENVVIKNTDLNESNILKLSTPGIFTSISLSNNSLHNASSLFFGLVRADLTFINTIITDTNAYSESRLFLCTGAKLNFLNSRIENGKYDKDSFFFKFSTGSTLKIQDTSIINHTREDLGDFMGSFGTSYLLSMIESTVSLSNSLVDTISDFMLAMNAQIDIQNVHFKNLKPTHKSRQFIFTSATVLNMKSVTIEGDKDFIGEADSILVCGAGQVNLDGLIISNFLTKTSIVLNLLSTDLSMINSQFINTSSQSGSLILVTSASSLYIQSTYIQNAYSPLESQSVSSVSLLNLTLKTDQLSFSPFSITDSTIVNISQFNLDYTPQTTSEISSFLAISDVSSTLSISKSTFSNLTTKNGALTIDLSLYTPIVSISNVTFINNTGVLSGAMSLTNSLNCQVKIENCNFIENKALDLSGSGGKGGAIYLETNQNFGDPSFSVAKCLFQKNRASINGGAIFVNGQPPSLEANVFEQNIAEDRINNLASQGVRLKLKRNGVMIKEGTSLSKANIGVIRGVGSGIALDGVIELIIYDYYDQVVVHDSASTIDISSNSSGFSSSIISNVAARGVYRLDGIVFSFGPGKNATAIISSTGIADFASAKFESFPESNLVLSFRDCIYGEYLQSDGTCISCPYGFAKFDYSVNSITPCEKCNPESMICLGGNQIGSNIGFFRFNETADIFLPCDPPGICLGNFVDQNYQNSTQCLQGYEGNMCDKCADGLVKNNKKECNLCSESYFQYFFFFLGVCFHLYLIRNGMRDIHIKAQKYSDTISNTKNDYDDSSALTKILVNYLQIINLIQALNVQWPKNIASLGAIGQNVAISSQKIFSVPCLYPKDSTRTVFIDLLITSFAPLAFLIVVVLYLLLHGLIKKSFNKEDFIQDIFRVLIVLFSNFQTPILMANTQVFQCINLYRSDNPVEFHTGDYDLKCWEGEHMQWALYFSLPVTVIWSVILPSIYLSRLYKNRKSLQQDDTIKKYSFFYLERKPEAYYWDFVVMVRKYILIPVIIFVGKYDSLFQIILALYFMVIFFLTEMKNKPYAKEYLNNIETLGLLSICFLTCSGLFYYFIDDNYALRIIIQIIPFVFIVFFLISWMRNFLREYFFKLRNQIISRPQVRKSLKKNCNFLTKVLKIDKELDINARRNELIDDQMTASGLSRLKSSTQSKTRVENDKDIDRSDQMMDSELRRFNPDETFNMKVSEFIAKVKEIPQDNEERGNHSVILLEKIFEEQSRTESIQGQVKNEESEGVEETQKEISNDNIDSLEHQENFIELNFGPEEKDEEEEQNESELPEFVVNNDENEENITKEEINIYDLENLDEDLYDFEDNEESEKKE